MSYIRYYLPVMGLLYLPFGGLAAQLYEHRSRLFNRAIFGAVGVGWLLAGLYCAALDYSLITDTRNRTADWFVQHVPKGTPVLSGIRWPYGPKLTRYGYRFIEQWKVPPLPELLAQQNQLPHYVVVSNDWLSQHSPEASAFRTALLKGQTDYKVTATFVQNDCLKPKKSWMSLACWPLMPLEGTSPEMHILQKEHP